MSNANTIEELWFSNQNVKLIIVINVIIQALDLVPKKIHERAPIFLGSYDDVEEIKKLYATEEQK